MARLIYASNIRERVEGAASGAFVPPAGAVDELEDMYAELLTRLDGEGAIRRTVERVPETLGFDLAWVGVPAGDDGDDELVLRHVVRARTDAVNGLVVPRGAGLGGKVLVQKRPLWVRDYCTAPQITHDFETQAKTEGLRSMIAVPIAHDERILGVLYASTRYEADFGGRAAELLSLAAERTAVVTAVAKRARYAAEVAVHEERRRLALDLHDDVGARLYTLCSTIQWLSDELAAHAPALGLGDRLDDLKEQATEALAAFRGSLDVLHAPPQQFELGVRLREDVRALRDRTGVDARVLVLTELPSLSPSRTRALTAAVREALLNVEKHALAGSVVVALFAADDGVSVTVSDDGIGLTRDPTTAGGIGLDAAADRLARLGGRLHLSDSDEGGCTVRAWVPV